MPTYDEDITLVAGIKVKDVDAKEISKVTTQLKKAADDAIGKTAGTVADKVQQDWVANLRKVERALDNVIKKESEVHNKLSFHGNADDWAKLQNLLGSGLYKWDDSLTSKGGARVKNLVPMSGEEVMDQLYKKGTALNDAYKRLDDKSREWIDTLSGASPELEKLNGQADKLLDKFQSLVNEGKRFEPLGSTNGTPDLIGDSMTAFKPNDGLELMSFMKDAEMDANLLDRALSAIKPKFKEISLGGEEAGKSLATMGATNLDPLAAMLKNVGEAALSVSKKIAQITLSLVKMGASKVLGAVKNLASSLLGLDKSSKSASDSLKHLGRNILRYGFGVRSLYFAFRKLRRALAEGINNIEEFGGPTNSATRAITQLKATLEQLKNAWGAAFAPIITYVAPVLNQLLTLLINAANTVGAFFATLTGRSTVIRAVKTEASLGKATGGTTKKLKEQEDQAEKTKDVLADFDRLNVLNPDTDDNLDDMADDLGDLGGAGGDLGESLFEEVPLTNEFAKWLNTDDWTELGRLIAAKLTNALVQLDDWINNTFRPWGVKWATRLATLINGFFSYDELFVVLGKTIADGLNAIADIFNTFIEKINFVHIGAQLHQAVASLFDNLDFELIGRALANRWNWIIDLFYGFISEFIDNAYTYGFKIGDAVESMFHNIHWDELGADIGTGLMSISETIRGFINNDEMWDEIKTGINTAIQSFLDNFDAAEFTANLNGLLYRLIDVIKSLPWAEVAMQIGQVLGGLDWGAALETVFTVIGDVLIGGITGILTGAVNTTSQKLSELTSEELMLVNSLVEGGMSEAAAVAHVYGLHMADAEGSGYSNVKEILGMTQDEVWASSQQHMDEMTELYGSNTGEIKDTVTKNSTEMTTSVAENLTETKRLSAEAMAYINTSVGEFMTTQTETIDMMFTDAIGRNYEFVITQTDLLITTLNEMLIAAMELLDSELVAQTTTIMSDIKAKIDNSMDTILLSVTTKINTKLTEWDKAIRKVITDGFTFLKTTTANELNAVEVIVNSVWDRIESRIRNCISRAANAVVKAAYLMKMALKEVLEIVKGVVEGVQSAVDTLNGSSIHPYGTVGSMPVGVPHLATGGVIPPNSEFLAVLGDQKQGTNIEAPLDTIVEAFRNVVGNMEVQNTGYSEMTLDGETFARLIVPYVVSELNRQNYDVTVLEG